MKKRKSVFELPQYDVILFDTMNLAAIQYYSKKFLSYKGIPTGMLYGFLNTVIRLKSQYSEADMYFLWEGYRSIRKARVSSYKRGRTTAREDAFLKSLDDVKDTLQYVKCYEITLPGLEADDLAGYYCTEFAGKKILLVSNDADWYQFLKSDNTVHIFSKGVVHQYDEIYAKMQFPPERVVLYKILRGDSSDNIAGIKRFPDLLARYIVRKTADYKDILNITFPAKYKRWREIIKINWSIVERNAMLIKYNPEWITESLILIKERSTNRKKLAEKLKQRGITSLLDKLEVL